MLAFAIVHGQLHGVAVAAMEGFVDVEERLHVVVAWGNVVEGDARVADGRVVNGDGLAGGEIVGVHAENLLRFEAVADLEPWLAVVILG